MKEKPIGDNFDKIPNGAEIYISQNFWSTERFFRV